MGSLPRQSSCPLPTPSADAGRQGACVPPSTAQGMTAGGDSGRPPGQGANKGAGWWVGGCAGRRWRPHPTQPLRPPGSPGAHYSAPRRSHQLSTPAPPRAAAIGPAPFVSLLLRRCPPLIGAGRSGGGAGPGSWSPACAAAGLGGGWGSRTPFPRQRGPDPPRLALRPGAGSGPCAVGLGGLQPGSPERSRGEVAGAAPPARQGRLRACARVCCAVPCACERRARRLVGALLAPV